MTKDHTLFDRLYARLWNVRRLSWWLSIRLGGKVAGGFFAGMRYVPRGTWGNPGNKVLGTYELELIPTFTRLDAQPPTIIFDVGASDGYYAVGLAWRWKGVNAQVYCWETDPHSQALLAAGSAKNQVQDRIRIYGECTEPELFQSIQAHDPGLIIMDIEGAERELCSQRCIEASHGVWIVECHLPEIVETLKTRFESRYEIELIPDRPRTSADIQVRLPFFSTPLPNDRRRLVDEWRPFATPWIVATPPQK